jgi:hypothetical protein
MYRTIVFNVAAAERARRKMYRRKQYDGHNAERQRRPRCLLVALLACKKCLHRACHLALRGRALGSRHNNALACLQLARDRWSYETHKS